MISPIGQKNNGATKGIGEIVELGPLKSGWTELAALCGGNLELSSSCPMHHPAHLTASLHIRASVLLLAFRGRELPLGNSSNSMPLLFSFLLLTILVAYWAIIFHTSEQGTAPTRLWDVWLGSLGLSSFQQTPCDQVAFVAAINTKIAAACTSKTPHLQNLLLPRQWGNFPGQGLSQSHRKAWVGRGLKIIHFHPLP